MSCVYEERSIKCIETIIGVELNAITSGDNFNIISN